MSKNFDTIRLHRPIFTPLLPGFLLSLAMVAGHANLPSQQDLAARVQVQISRNET